MDSYFKNPSTNLEPTESEPMYDDPNTASSNSKETTGTFGKKSDPNHYARGNHQTPISTSQNAAYEEVCTTDLSNRVDQIDSGNLMNSMSRSSTIVPTDEECIYDNDPPNSPDKMTTNNAYGTFQNNVSTEEERIYDNDPPHMSEEECIYDNDPPNMSEEDGIYDNDPPNSPGMSDEMTTNEAYGTFQNNVSTEEECIYDNDPPHKTPTNKEFCRLPNTEEECIYDNDPMNEPTVSLINNSATTDDGEDDIYDNDPLPPMTPFEDQSCEIYESVDN